MRLGSDRNWEVQQGRTWVGLRVSPLTAQRESLPPPARCSSIGHSGHSEQPTEVPGSLVLSVPITASGYVGPGFQGLTCNSSPLWFDQAGPLAGPTQETAPPPASLLLLDGAAHWCARVELSALTTGGSHSVHRCANWRPYVTAVWLNTCWSWGYLLIFRLLGRLRGHARCWSGAGKERRKQNRVCPVSQVWEPHGTLVCQRGPVSTWQFFLRRPTGNYSIGHRTAAHMSVLISVSD